MQEIVDMLINVTCINQTPVYSEDKRRSQGDSVLDRFHYINISMETFEILLQCTVKGLKFLLMTSHLESTKDHAKERKNQLKQSLGHMMAADHDATVIFGGDLNLRDKEVQCKN